MADLFDLAEARSQRDAAMCRVRAVNAGWFNDALGVLTSPGFQNTFRRFTGEDLRDAIEDRLGPPTHPNAYGSLIMTALKHNVIEKTGVWEPMKLKSSHGRQTPVYRWSV